MDENSPAAPRALEPEDFYFEGPNIVFSAAYHLKRGSCCGSGCRHCPYPAEEKLKAGNYSNPPLPETSV